MATAHLELKPRDEYRQIVYLSGSCRIPAGGAVPFVVEN
jgi:hypothetical protein